MVAVLQPGDPDMVHKHHDPLPWAIGLEAFAKQGFAKASNAVAQRVAGEDVVEVREQDELGFGRVAPPEAGPGEAQTGSSWGVWGLAIRAFEYIKRSDGGHEGDDIMSL
jgi:hypothetical protein